MGTPAETARGALPPNLIPGTLEENFAPTRLAPLNITTVSLPVWSDDGEISVMRGFNASLVPLVTETVLSRASVSNIDTTPCASME